MVSDLISATHWPFEWVGLYLSHTDTQYYFEDIVNERRHNVQHVVATK